MALCVSPAVALAESCTLQTTWTLNGTGSWFVAANWDHGVPTTAHSAEIHNGRTAQINSSGANACSLTLGLNSTNSGTVSVDNGSLTMSGEALVGSYGRGTLTIKNGGTVAAGSAAIAAFVQGIVASVGTVSVDGSTCTISGAAWIGGTENGPGGTGLLSVTNSASVSAGSVRAWNSGTLTGNGTVTTTNGTTIERTLTPSGGTLTIVGDLTFSGNVAAMECHVVPASADNVTVSGVASLAGKISVTMTGTTFTAGTRYTLLHAAGGFDPNHFQFQTVSIKGGSGDCFTPLITYDANNVYLYLAPCSN